MNTMTARDVMQCGCTAQRRRPPRVPLRAAARVLTLCALAIACVALAAYGERWMLRAASTQSIEYQAATCAADALYGGAAATPPRSCNNPGINTGKSS